MTHGPHGHRLPPASGNQYPVATRGNLDPTSVVSPEFVQLGETVDAFLDFARSQEVMDVLAATNVRGDQVWWDGGRANGKLSHDRNITDKSTPRHELVVSWGTDIGPEELSKLPNSPNIDGLKIDREPNGNLTGRIVRVDPTLGAFKQNPAVKPEKMFRTVRELSPEETLGAAWSLLREMNDTIAARKEAFDKQPKQPEPPKDSLGSFLGI